MLAAVLFMALFLMVGYQFGRKGYAVKIYRKYTQTQQ